MSEKNNAAKTAEAEKVMTKYDLKMQRKTDAAAKARKEEKRGMIIGIVLVVALVAFVASFPIRSYLAVYGQYIRVGGEKVTQIEFDMQYNMSKQSFIQQMGQYLSMFGITDMDTLESQIYHDNMTYGDYFSQMAAESLVQQRGLAAKAKEVGFTYDVDADMDMMKSALEELAKEEGTSLDAYVQNIYGSLATWNRIKPYLEEATYASAYYNEVMADKMPSEEDIQAEYEANKDKYDVIDYHMTLVMAELPTMAPDGTVEKDEEGNEIPYEPTEEEIEAAMKEAYKKAQEAEKTVAKDGTEYTGASLSSANAYIKDFLADENREPGDTMIAEVSASNLYRVVSFDRRYQDQTPTHDFRMICSSTTDAQTILDEWKAGEATEESFLELVEKYDEAGGASTGGYYSGMTASTMAGEAAEWLAAGRVKGDTLAYNLEEGASYVFYYLAEGNPAWKTNAASAVLNARMTAFIEEAIAGVEIEDKDKKLTYLYLEEE